MPHFNLHNLSAVLSPRAALRRRRNNSTSSSNSMSSVSSTSSIRSMNSTSNVSLASRQSSESIFSSTTNATSNGDHHEHHTKSPISSVPHKKSNKSSKKPSSLHATLRPRPSAVDLYGFHMIDDVEETFTPELVILEPRPAVRFDGFLETLDQANALAFASLKV